MGDYIEAYDKEGNCIASARMGSDGARKDVIALFLAAYGLDKQPESKRVREGWIKAATPVIFMFDPKHPGCPSRQYKTVKWLRQMIAYNCGQCNWIKITTGYCHGGQYQQAGIELGLKFKKPKCPKLKLLVSLHEACADPVECEIKPEIVKDLAPYLCHLLGFLDESCWHSMLSGVVRIFYEADMAGGKIRIRGVQDE